MQPKSDIKLDAAASAVSAKERAYANKQARHSNMPVNIKKCLEPS